jgi:hypothetical protein
LEAVGARWSPRGGDGDWRCHEEAPRPTR